MNTISIILAEFKHAWDSLPIPEEIDFFADAVMTNPHVDDYVAFYDVEYLREQVLGKKYNEFTYYTDDSFGKYLSSAAMCYYYGSWINGFLIYNSQDILSDILSHTEAGNVLVDRLSDHNDLLKLCQCFTCDQMKVLIKVLNLFIDYNDYFNERLNKENISNLIISSFIVRSALSRGMKQPIGS